MSRYILFASFFHVAVCVWEKGVRVVVAGMGGMEQRMHVTSLKTSTETKTKKNLSNLKACSSLGELLVYPTWFRQFDELYFFSELSVRQTFQSPKMVWTVQQTILHFSTDLLTRYKLQPKLRCQGCTQTCEHMFTHDTCSLWSIREWKPRQ